MIKVGVICPSEIAFRRFMPALKLVGEFEFVGLGVCTAHERFGESLPDKDTVAKVLGEEHRKAQEFVNVYGGKIFEGYETIASSEMIDALYIPLPPSLHFKWAQKSLEYGKHVMVEKPSTLSVKETQILTQLSQERGLGLHENYMFAFHKQLEEIQKIIAAGEIGKVRLYRISFGFPRRASSDFRYSKALGGGALYDCGGYTLKYARMLLGETARLICAQSNYTEEFDVDIFGAASLTNDNGDMVQVAFGMDNDYRCDLDVWGTEGSLFTGRILTAPAGFAPEVSIKKNNKVETRKFSEDNTFVRSLEYFMKCIEDTGTRKSSCLAMQEQAHMVESFQAKLNAEL